MATFPALQVVDTFSQKFASRMNPQQLQTRATQVMNQMRADAIKQLATYPPQVQGSRYRRTGDYGRGWALGGVLAGTNATGFRLTNRVQHRGRSYAVWVGGPTNRRPGQARLMGRRGWVSVTTVAKYLRQKYRTSVQTALVITR